MQIKNIIQVVTGICNYILYGFDDDDDLTLVEEDFA